MWWAASSAAAPSVSVMAVRVSASGASAAGGAVVPVEGSCRRSPRGKRSPDRHELRLRPESALLPAPQLVALGLGGRSEARDLRFGQHAVPVVELVHGFPS